MDNKLLLAVAFEGVDKLTGPIRNIIGAGRSGSQALKAMKAEARDLGRQLADVRRAMAGSSGNVSDLVNQERALERALANANTELAAQRQHLERINAINAQADRIRGRGEALRQSGAGDMATGAGILAPLLLAAKGAGDFQDGMIDIAQKANLTAQETDRMQRSILAAAIAAKRLPEEMRQGVDVLAGFGLDPRSAAQIIGPIGRFVTAYRADMAEVGQATFAGIDNLKIPLGEVTKMLDIMAFAGKAGAFEAKDLAATMPALSAAYQGMGQKGAGAFAQLAAGAEIARKGAGNSEVAGNNLLNLLNKMTSVDAIKNFKKQGVDLASALKDSKDPLETIVMLAQKVTGGDPMKLNQLFQDQQVLGALRPLMANLPEYRKMRDEALAAAGTTDRDFAQRASGAGANWSALMGNMQRLGIVAGSLLLPTLVEVSGKIGNVIQRVADWAEANPELAGSIMRGVAYLGAFKVGLGALKIAFGTLLGPVATAYKWFKLFRNFGGFTGALMRMVPVVQKAGPVLARSFGMMRTAAMFLGKGMLRAGAMMLANPIVLIIAGIAVAALLLYKYWTPISEFFIGVWGRIKSAFSGVGAWFGSVWEGVKSVFSKYGVAMLAPIAPFLAIPMLIYNNWDTIKGFFGRVWEGVKSATQTGIDWFASLPGKFASFGSSIISGLINALSPTALVDRLLSIARSGITAFKNFFGIKSPSRVFMSMGDHITQGLAIGLDRGRGAPLRSMARITAGLGGAAALGLASPSLGGTGPGAMGGTPTPGAAVSAAGVTYNVTIKIDGTSGDPRQLAIEVKRELDALLAIDARGSYEDA